MGIASKSRRGGGVRFKHYSLEVIYRVIAISHQDSVDASCSQPPEGTPAQRRILARARHDRGLSGAATLDTRSCVTCAVARWQITVSLASTVFDVGVCFMYIHESKLVT